MVREDTYVQPREEPVLCEVRGGNETFALGESDTHLRSRPFVLPPAVNDRARLHALGPNDPPNVFERRLVERRLGFRHVDPEVDDPHVARATRQVKSVDPGAHDIGVRATIRVRGRKKRPGWRRIDVERTALRVAHEGDPDVLQESPCSREVDADRQVRIDAGDRLTVELAVRLTAVVLAYEADMDVGPGKDPRVVGAGEEDSARTLDLLEDPPIGASADALGGEQPRPPGSPP